MAAPQPPPVALPAQPNDPAVPIPAAPVFPPTPNNVLQAVSHAPGVRCTVNDRYNSILYEHSVVAQAVAAANPQDAAPPWFQGTINQLRADLQNDMQERINQLRADLRLMILPDLRRLMNQGRGDGAVISFEVVPFNNGTNPNEAPNNLPILLSVNHVENLTGQQLRAYLAGYGIDPLPAGPNPVATNHLRKETLKRLIGASV